MGKKLIEGNELLPVPPIVASTGAAPVIPLRHGLVLDDTNCWQYPTVILGAVGTGKTTLIHSIMEPLEAHLDQSGDNAVIFAPKPSMLRYARPGDIIIRVGGTEPESCWSIFAELDASDDPESTLREITDDLFAEQKKKTLQSFFPNAAADIFMQTVRFMYDYSKAAGRPASNGDLVEFLESTPICGDGDTPGWVELSRLHPEYFGMLRDYIGNGTEQGLGVLSELRLLISRTFLGSFCRYDGRFSALEAIRQGSRVFLYYEYNKAKSALSLFKIILDLLLKAALDAGTERKTWFVLDEFSQLPALRNLIDALSLGRDPADNGSGSGGVRIIAALQSARLLQHHYSQKEADILMSLFPNMILMGMTPDPLSRTALSCRYGEARYQYSYAGLGDRTHYVDATEQVISDHHFSRVTQRGQAIMSLPLVSEHPFFYDGHRKEATHETKALSESRHGTLQYPCRRA